MQRIVARMWAVCSLLAGPLAAWAEEPPSGGAQAPRDEKPAEPPRLAPFRQMYAGFGRASGDERHTEVFYSFRYRISDQNVFTEQRDNYLFFSYTGAFDFYWVPFHNTRESGPVVNRLNNPELHFRLFFDRERPKPAQQGEGLAYLDVALGHESNGQTVSDLRQFEAAGRYRLDAISRAWNYASIEGQVRTKGGNCGEWLGCAGIEAALRHFFAYGREDTVFWEPGNRATIEQYDGLRIGAFKEWDADPSDGTPRYGAALSYRTGTTRPFRHNTFVATGHFQVPLFGRLNPLAFIRYFHGYGQNISEYTRHTSYWLFGVRFR